MKMLFTPSYRKLPHLIFLGMFSSINAHGEWLTEIESEVAYSDKQEETTKTDLAVKLEWEHRFDNQIDVKVIPKLLINHDDSLSGTLNSNFDRAENFSPVNGPAYEDKNHRIELSEAYMDMWLGDGSLRAGKQQVVWGQADGLKVLDVINPQNFREFNLPEFEDSRIPTWMVNLQHPAGEDSTIQLLLIPDMTFNELADLGSDFRITSPELAPQPVPGVPVSISEADRPDGEWEFGTRWSTFKNGWDITANYFNFFQDNAVYYRDLNGGTVFVTPTYERSQLLGFSASTAMESWVWKVEAGYTKDNYFLTDDITVASGIQKSDEFSSVFAFDYHGFTNLMLSYQLFYSQILDYDEAVIREESSIRHTLLVRKNLWNETLELRLFTLFNDDYDDGQNRIKATYKVNDNWSVWSGIDHFYGDEQGPFGQFKDASRITFGWQWAY